MKKTISMVLALVMVALMIPVAAFTTSADSSADVQSVKSKEVPFPNVTNVQVLSSVDFTTIKSDEALEAAGWKFYGKTPENEGDYIERIEYGDDGLDLLFGDSILLNTEIEMNSTDSYIIDYTFRWNPSHWLFYMAVGFDPAALIDPTITNSDQMVEKLKENWNYIDHHSSFKIHANENDGGMAAVLWEYCDKEFFNQFSTKLPSETALNAACGEEKAPIRIRMLIPKGAGQKLYAVMTIGDEHFYLMRSPFMDDSVFEGLIGFTMLGSANDNRGVTLQSFSVSKCDLVDDGAILVENGIRPEKPIVYTDDAATKYKDGYVLHHMDFSKVTDWESVGYSFKLERNPYRDLKLDGGVLKIRNRKPEDYIIFTANAIPKTITEYTAKYRFRFVVAADTNSAFGFIRGIALKEDGTRDNSKDIKIHSDGTIYGAVTEDTAAWEKIVAAMNNGEWVDVTISNVGRCVEFMTVKCGENTVTFTINDSEENKIAEEGYMGFIIRNETYVEIASVTILAGSAEKAADPIWPTGTRSGDLVQNVTADAVVEEIKSDPKPDETTTAPATTTTTTKTEAKKGCKGSIVAVPVIIATAVLGCAIVCKKKINE